MKMIYKKMLRKLQSSKKHLSQIPYYLKPATVKQPVFVSGCQRTGTTTLIRVLDKSAHTTAYYENNKKAFQECRLRDYQAIQSLIHKNKASHVIFDVKCDAHHIHHLLDLHPASRIIWVYRDYLDSIPYAVLRWQTHQRDVMKWIKNRQWDTLGWRGENLSDELIQLASDLYNAELTAEDGAAFFWYLRNQFFFYLGLDRDERIRLLNYKDYVMRPLEVLPPVFEFINLPFEARMVSELSPAYIGKYPRPTLKPVIQQLCDTLLAKLDRCHKEPQSLLYEGFHMFGTCGALVFFLTA